MSFINVNNFLNRNYEGERELLLRDLSSAVRDCREKYGNKSELATETDSR